MDSAQRKILPEVAGPARPGTHRVRPSGRRRRPSGEAPPLPHHLQTSGVGSLVALVVLVALSIMIFAGGFRGPAVAVTVLDDAAVRWLAGLGRVALGAEAPTDVLVGAAIGVTIPLVLFRLFAPQPDLPHPVPPGPQRPPGRHRPPGRGHPAGPGGPAGVQVAEVTPFGLAGSAGSTPLRITVKGDPPRQLFGKLYARSHLRADRWYKLARERPSRPQPHESSACWRSSTVSTNRVSRETFGAARFGQR
jgi:hypothetical protein